MKVGDKVKNVKGNPFGKIGVIKHELFMTKPTNLAENPTGLKSKPQKNFLCASEDGTTFTAFEDELELVK